MIKPIKQNNRSPSKARGSVSPQKQVGKSIDAAMERKVTRPAVKLSKKKEEPAINEDEEEITPVKTEKPKKKKVKKPENLDTTDFNNRATIETL